jgi:hypothetical protein
VDLTSANTSRISGLKAQLKSFLKSFARESYN